MDAAAALHYLRAPAHRAGASRSAGPESTRVDYSSSRPNACARETASERDDASSLR
jgi:hypothetical protein